MTNPLRCLVEAQKKSMGYGLLIQGARLRNPKLQSQERADWPVAG